MTSLDDLIDRMKAGDRRALARLMTLVENESPEVGAVFARIHRDVGRARRVGVTGPPGAGKSSLVGRLIEALRAAGETVGVVAVDPTSPVSGGALLGDRLRMGDLNDAGVFIRSMASRGCSGGLARQSLDVADLLDAFGQDWIFIETVGTGQGELEVIHETDTVVVVLHPGAGDSVQAMKSGLFDVGDIFAVNKADRPDAKALKAELEWAFHLRDSQSEPAVVMTSARENRGVDDLVAAIRDHHHQLATGGTLQASRLGRVKKRLRRQVEEAFRRHLDADPEWTRRLDTLSTRIVNQEVDRYSAYEELSGYLERRIQCNQNRGS